VREAVHGPLRHFAATQQSVAFKGYSDRWRGAALELFTRWKVISGWHEQFQVGATAQPRFKILFTEQDRAASVRASAQIRSASMITLRKIIAFAKRTQCAPGDR
jgi:hypothetical protein